MIESNTAQVLQRLHATIDAAFGELAGLIAEGIRDDIAEAFPPASEPGTPPHSRTGNLLRGVAAFSQREGGVIQVQVSSSREGEDGLVPVYLEYGTSKMAARPYMGPAQTEWQERAPALMPEIVEAHFHG